MNLFSCGLRSLSHYDNKLNKLTLLLDDDEIEIFHVQNISKDMEWQIEPNKYCSLSAGTLLFSSRKLPIFLVLAVHVLQDIL
ncbi:conserved hypothetical protein [Xenorhabdus nematophila F1]|uniref:Uncharacterized protein n=1 Tax=Xenorhabdus nematophila (strain ATCC 19061 / DSM 3370 / CCUG 14189 / LMG 1036 / NCIMB 9965 / AN6) TaxID=406817 RepID=D3VEL6_XENNA|nr:hypothetical protein XNC1_2068 [Xenorhabdus nematophila ATCC 19061]CCW32109.1 conserved hypothetical protein [Xenorhabdus nematophila F1]